MSKLQIRAFFYQLICFAVLFILFRVLIYKYIDLKGFFIPLTAFILGTILAPKFQAIKTKDGEKLYMRWMFLKGTREVK